VITGDLKSKIDRVWDAFWSGGISNPLEVIEQITYLLFLRRLDDLQVLAEKKARINGGPIQDPPFLPGQAHLRWSYFKNLDADVMFKTVGTQVFPFLQQYGAQVGGDDSTYSEHMKDARFTIPTAALLSKVVDLLADIPMANRDTNGDLYEYMLGKIASAGQNGQFRTPRHIIRLMVDMTAPQPGDEICDPACGTAGFLVAASEYVREQHPGVLTDAGQRRHFHRSMFHGYDFDNVMLRIGSMNMLLHGIEAPDIRYRDSLSEGATVDAEKYTLILANPPFAGSLDYEATSKDLQRVVKTKKTEVLFLALFLKLLKAGGKPRSSSPMGCSSAPPMRTRNCAGSSSRSRSSTPWSSCRLGSSVRMPVSRRQSSFSPRPTPVAPRTSGSTTCEPTDSRWTTSATRSMPTTSRMCSPGGRTSTPSRTVPAPTSRSSCRRPTSSPRATTSRSTATRRSSTGTSSTVPH